MKLPALFPSPQRRSLGIAALSTGLAALPALLTPSPAPAQTELPEIVVNAPPGEKRSASTDLIPLTVVTADELLRNWGANLGDMLQSRPGISGTSYAPGANRPVIRGLDNFRVRIQENGVATQDVSDLGEDHGVPIDPLAAQQIEVVRGPAALRFGSSAIGGVVNITNSRIPDRIPERPVMGEVRGGVSSVDRSFESAAIVDAGANGFAVHADGFARTAGDYATPLGTQANSALRANGQSFGMSAIGADGFAGIAVSRFASLYHIPGVEPAATNTRIDLDQLKVSAKGEIRPDSALVAAVRQWFGASTYHHDELGLDGAGLDGVRATFRSAQQESRSEVQFQPTNLPFATVTTTAGLQLSHQTLGTSGDAGALLAPNESYGAGAYLFNEWRITDAFRIQTAGRAEFDDVRGTPASFPADFLGSSGAPVDFDSHRQFLPLSASIGFLANLPMDVVGRLTGQYVERAPRAAELFSKGAHDAPGTFEIGDPALKKEAASTVEAGFKRSTGPFRFDLSAYVTHYNGFIYKRETGIRCDDDFASCGTGTELAQIVYAQRNALFVGGEWSAQLDVVQLAGGTFGLDTMADIVRARFEDGTNVPRIPAARLGGGAWWRNDNWFTRLGVIHAFDQNFFAPGSTPTPGYDNLRAEISYRRTLTPGAGLSEFAVGLVGDNLLNQEIRNAVSYRKDEVLLPGRNVRFFASVKF